MLPTLLAFWLSTAASPPPPVVDPAPVVTVSAAVPATAPRKDKGPALAQLHGVLAWVVAGGLGALVPLALLTLPFFWLPLLGPYGVMGVLVAVGWGTFAVGLGGALAYTVMLLFSDVRSGFLYPLLTAALVGAGGVVLSTLLAAVFAFPLVMLATLFTWVNVSPSSWWYWYAYPANWYSNPFSGVATAVALVVWSAGLVATAVAGPLAAAWVYDRYGMPREGDSVQVDLLTPSHPEAAPQKTRTPAVAIVPGPDDDGAAREDRSGRPARKARSKKPPRSKGRPTTRASATNAEVGAACSSDEDCAVVCTTQKEFGGGMCTMPCNSTLDCPPGSACIDTSGGICAVTCTSNADCSGFGSPRVCGSFYERNGGAAKACQAP